MREDLPFFDHARDGSGQGIVRGEKTGKGRVREECGSMSSAKSSSVAPWGNVAGRALRDSPELEGSKDDCLDRAFTTQVVVHHAAERGVITGRRKGSLIVR